MSGSEHHSAPPAWEDIVRRVLALVYAEFGARVQYVDQPGTEALDPNVVEAPVVMPDGSQRGALRMVRAVGRDGDLRVARLLAGLMAERMALASPVDVAGVARAAQIRTVLRGGELDLVFQPIVDLRTDDTVGVEALARFPDGEAPDRWFADAETVGLGVELELLAVRCALTALPTLADSTYLSVNVSPATLGSPALARLLRRAPAHRVVLELTEHAAVGDYLTLNAAIRRLRARGTRLAIDDAGSGFASLRHILRLAPDIIKLDVSLTNGIDADPVLRALADALSSFAAAIDVTVIAEGVETEREVDTLRLLGVVYGQGYFLHRPTVLAGPGISRTTPG